MIEVTIKVPKNVNDIISSTGETLYFEALTGDDRDRSLKAILGLKNQPPATWLCETEAL